MSEYVVLDVFTTTPFQGNPLAVLTQAEGLSDAAMQAIAKEFNLSETVFVLPPRTDQAVKRLRIFTPQRELAFAGHPTIGAASLLGEGKNFASPFFIEEEIGLVRIDRDSDSRGGDVFWLTTPPVTFYETLEPDFCARLLSLNAGDVRADSAPCFASAGSPLLFVCLQSAEAVDRAVLDQTLLSGAMGTVDSVGTFLFARKHPESETDFDVYARMFAPQTGIAEDPATGGATGPLAAYMMRTGLLPSDRSIEFVSEQGTKMGRRSLLHVRTNAEDKSIRVGGSTVRIARGNLLA